MIATLFLSAALAAGNVSAKPNLVSQKLSVENSHTVHPIHGFHFRHGRHGNKHRAGRHGRKGGHHVRGHGKNHRSERPN